MSAKNLDVVQDATVSAMNPEPPTEANAAVAVVDRSAYLQAPDVDPNDIYVPRLKLGQATTTEVVAGDARAGQWVIQGYQGMANPTIVPISYKKVWRRVALLPGKPVACYDHKAGPNEDCDNCRWQFDRALDKGGFEATNNPVHNFVVFVDEINGPAAVEFTGTSETAGKMLVGKVVGRGLGNFAVRLGSSPAKNGKGSWYVAAIQELTDVPSALLARVQEFVK